MKNWAENLGCYYSTMEMPFLLPEHYEWLIPQINNDVKNIIVKFFLKYYNDNNSRTLLLGINPGRFGAGLTGVNFTAPKQLTEICRIENEFKSSSELSSEFIYEVICRYGGPDLFFKTFFIGSVCPLGISKFGKNVNYYDNNELLMKVEPIIIKNLEKLLTCNSNRQVCYCIGEGQNLKYLARLNGGFNWFAKIKSLPHPRFIMQYKRKNKDEYVNMYLEILKNL